MLFSGSYPFAMLRRTRSKSWFMDTQFMRSKDCLTVCTSFSDYICLWMLIPTLTPAMVTMIR